LAESVGVEVTSGCAELEGSLLAAGVETESVEVDPLPLMAPNKLSKTRTITI